MKIIFTMLLFVCAVSAGTVNLSDYATANDGLSDSAGLQEAIADLPDGGTILIGAGTWDLRSPVTFVTSNSSNSFTLKGQKGAVLKPDLNPWQTLFESGNQNQMNFEDLVVAGSGSDDDFYRFLTVAYTWQLRIRGCQFFGLRSKAAFINVHNTDAVIKDSLFLGLSSGEGIIITDNSKGLTVEDSEFIDYGNLNGVYHSKTPSGNPAWIKVLSSVKPTGAMSQRGLLLKNVRFDEGAQNAVVAYGVTYIQANSVMVNVSGIGDAGGFYLSDVKYAEIKASHFGFTTNPRPAVRALNGSTVYLDGVTLGDGVFYGVRDQSSQAFFNLRACTSGCAFTVLPQPIPLPFTNK